MTVGLRRELHGHGLGQRVGHRQPAADGLGGRVRGDLRRRGDAPVGLGRRVVLLGARRRSLERRELRAHGLARGDDDLHADGDGRERLHLEQRAGGDGDRGPEADGGRLRLGRDLPRRRDDRRRPR